MNTHRCRGPVIALVVGLCSLAMSGCVVPEGGYGYHGNPGYGLGYYEPPAASYSGWGRGYDVGPVRSGTGYEQHGGAGYEQHGGHGRPAGRPVPSLPGRERAGGGA
ncbi:MAG: hypothetical protein ACREF0_04205 [Acetobacteraceae bacterium]